MAESAPQEQSPKVTKTQTFNLKAPESQTLMILQQDHQRSFAAVLSLLVQERMGYKVTEFTQFKLNGDFSEIEISELSPEAFDIAATPTEQKPEEPKSGVVTAA